jgi:undecaprenyl-diphosphatase
MLKYVILGIIQGLTEFLPVSSSGHLVIIKNILGMRGQELALYVVLHLGTSLSLIIFFFKDILKTLHDKKLLLLIAVITIITGVIGLLGKDFFERLFNSPKLVALALIVTGAILLLAQKFKEAKKDTVGFKDALFLGVMQAIAIIPGISRSGITISALLFRKIDRQTAFKFSFLASIPAVLGANFLEARKIEFVLRTGFSNFFAGFLSSLVTGIIALWVLKFILRKAKFHYFGYYCIFIAIITLLFK